MLVCQSLSLKMWLLKGDIFVLFSRAYTRDFNICASISKGDKFIELTIAYNTFQQTKNILVYEKGSIC